jgi:hypothetical protein
MEVIYSSKKLVNIYHTELGNMPEGGILPFIRRGFKKKFHYPFNRTSLNKSNASMTFLEFSDKSCLLCPLFSFQNVALRKTKSNS